jgi:RNA polymerase sigma factor (sigma-70 family)
MVLGTALTTLGSSAGVAAGASEMSASAVNDLSRYCTACWRNARLPADCWTDCTQEVFRRLLERVSVDSWDRLLHSESEERREFVRAIDTVKKRVQRERKRVSYATETVADDRDARERDLSEVREVVDRAAKNLLSPRQQTIMHKSFQGWSVHELADQLHLPPERVSDEKYKAITKLRRFFATARG